MSLTLPFSNSPELLEKDRDSWLVAYAAWYQHFLSMMPNPDRLHVGWSHEMVRSSLQPSWLVFKRGRSDSECWAGFDRIRAEFESQPNNWLAQANAIRERVLGDAVPALREDHDLSEATPTCGPSVSPTPESLPMPAATSPTAAKPEIPQTAAKQRRRTAEQLSFF